jgi:NAD+ kinase
MPREFTTVGLWGRLNEPSVAEPARQVLEHLTKRGIKVFAPAQAPGAAELTGTTRVDEKEFADHVGLCIAIGGDGTLLHAARHVAHRNVPLLGINRGRLGFLTDVSPEHMLETIDSILGGDYLAERRLMLAAEIGVRRGDHPPLLALNDVVLQKGEAGRMLDFVTTVDGTYVNTHRGDGLIVATPTGSTAYALSCGGPIIQPEVDALAMVPICPHTLSDRPLLLKSTSKIEVRLEDSDGAHVVCDGEELGRLAGDETLRIGLADRTVTLLHPRDYNYYELLRSKLNWGRANRNGAKPNK